MLVPQRKSSEVMQQVIPLLALGVILIASNRSITFIDDESLTLNFAAQPMRPTLAQFFFKGGPPYTHPPLFDILLHFWLRWAGGELDYLRVPSILFYIAGIFLLGRASRYFTGSSGGIAVIWTAVLWPFGFHFGRLTVWYACSFFFVSGVTLAYLKYLEEPTSARWRALFLFSLGLIWTNYVGWVILGCLALDLLLRRRNSELFGKPKALAGMAVLLGIAFVPLLLAFRGALRADLRVPHSPLATVANAAFDVFSLFVSESVAPWYWALSVPVGVAILVCMTLVVWRAPRPAGRFLAYTALLVVAMALIGILNTKRLLMISPWLLLPVGVAIEAPKPRWATGLLALALLVIGGLGWYGIYSRRFYSAPRFIEPWQEIAEDAAGKIRNGAVVIADHPSALLYLTYSLRVPNQTAPWRFAGWVTDAGDNPKVYGSVGWLDSGHPTSRRMILIRGGRDPGGNGQVDMEERQLDQACSSITSRLMMRDQGYAWKQRFFPQLGEPQWRIEIREYDCGASSSKQIYVIPQR